MAFRFDYRADYPIPSSPRSRDFYSRPGKREVAVLYIDDSSSALKKRAPSDDSRVCLEEKKNNNSDSINWIARENYGDACGNIKAV